VSIDGARRTEILETAADLFASSGLRTSLKEIADACGILPGSLYHHFESKEAIIVELIERYRADLDDVAERALAGLREPDVRPFPESIVALSEAIAACSVRHRAAVLLTFYEPPSAASDELVRVAGWTPEAIERAMLETLRLGAEAGHIRPGLDLDTLASRFCQTSLSVFQAVPGADRLPAVSCRILLDGIATPSPAAPHGPSDDELDGSEAFLAAERVLASWDKTDDEEDERVVKLRSVARTEFGRKGYEATTVRDIAKAAGMATGTVYRLIGSKDELLASIMGSFEDNVRSGWKSVFASGSTAIEKLDALMWININAVDRFNDEYNIQLAWLRESPPSARNPGRSLSARLRDVKTVIAGGTRSGELRVDAPTADIRAWAVFEALWLGVGIVRKHGARAALELGRESVLRGVATRA
jgi:AcrR family transcriptional regulator